MAPGPCTCPGARRPAGVRLARGADVAPRREAHGASAQTGDIVRRLHRRWDAAAEGVHLVYALAAAGSSCDCDLVRCTLGDGVSLCPQRCAAMAQDAETPSTQQLRLRRVLAFLAVASMLGIEVLEVKFID